MQCFSNCAADFRAFPLQTQSSGLLLSSPHCSTKHLWVPQLGYGAKDARVDWTETEKPALAGDRRSLTALLCVNGSGEDKLFRSKSADLELAMKKECVKKIRSEGSICEVSMEAELFTLRESNAKLVAALREANSSIEQWKNQLSEYQQETHRLQDQVAELEEQSGHSAASENKTEDLFQSVEDMEALLMAKDEEINKLQGRKSDFQDLVEEREEIYKRMQELEQRNLELEQQVQKAEQNLASSMEARQQAEGQVRKVIEVLDVKIFDLNNLRQSLDNFLNK
ncbi:homer protein homolog 3b isoform X2 [Tachysurus ichikawai]